MVKKYDKAEDCLQEALENGLWEQIMGVTLKDEDIEPARERLMKTSPKNQKKKTND